MAFPRLAVAALHRSQRAYYSFRGEGPRCPRCLRKLPFWQEATIRIELLLLFRTDKSLRELWSAVAGCGWISR